MATWVSTKKPSGVCESKKKKEDTVCVECKNREKKKRKVEHVMTMDRCKKMQCWAMLKRLMVGRDAWALQKDVLHPKILYVLDKSEAMKKPKGLEDIESKLKNSDYSEAYEFVDDVRLVLSYALQYPPRSEVHRTATRIPEGFEVNWKTMKEKWMREEEETNKICKRELHVCPNERSQVLTKIGTQLCSIDKSKIHLILKKIFHAHDTKFKTEFGSRPRFFMPIAFNIFMGFPYIAKHPRRKLVIKIFPPGSKVSYSCGANTPKDSIVSKVCELKNKKGYYAMTMWVNTENPSESCVLKFLILVVPRSKRFNSVQICESKKKKEDTVRVECKNREKKKRKVEHVMTMDHCKKMQCWIFPPGSKVSYSCGANTPKDSIVSKVCELKNKKGYYAMTMWVNTENPSESCVTDSRISRTEMATRVNTKNQSKVCESEKKKEDSVRVECKNREKKKQKVEHVMMMDRCKKMQCWAMLKRLMVGRDAWALQKDVLHPKIFYVLDKSEAMKKPKGLEDIESKLKNSDYSEAYEFVDDVRLVLSYALQYPPRSEVHRTATRITEGFEVNWKTMKEKWMREAEETNKICKRELHVCPNERSQIFPPGSKVSYSCGANTPKDSIVSKVCELKNKKGYYAMTMWVNTENPSESCVTDSRISRTEMATRVNTKNQSKVCESKKKKEDSVRVECKNREKKKQKVEHVMMMDRCKKMQCWAMLKRLMVGRDARALQKDALEGSKVSYSCGTNTPKDSIVSKVCELKNKKGYYAMTMWVNTENPSESCVTDSRISRTEMATWVNTKNPSEVCESKKKKEDSVRVECKNREKKKRKVEHVMTMDRCKKMQCWAMLKRLMVGRDAWALQKDVLHPKIFYVLDKSEAMKKPKGLEDIESKLKNSDYSEAYEFVDDVRLVLSYALQYPPRSEVHRTATRITEGFEVNWKTMKEKWMREEEETNKICKRELHVCPNEGSQVFQLVLSYALQYPSRSEAYRTATRITEGFEVNWKTMKEKWMHDEREIKKIFKRELHVCPNDDDEAEYSGII
ncbi:Transcription factor GTE12 [Glycine max]|nr:Transcription factor GTE12 [Glycine max]